MELYDYIIYTDYIINWIFRIGLLVLAYNIIEYLNYK